MKQRLLLCLMCSLFVVYGGSRAHASAQASAQVTAQVTAQTSAQPQAGVPMSETETNDIMQQMVKKLALNQSLKARFIQERQLAMFSDVLRSEGFIYFQRPGKIRWEFTKPYGSITIMLEKGDVEKYDVRNGKLSRVKTGSRQIMAEVLNQIVRWQKGDLSGAAEDFDVLLYKQDKGYKLVMKPRARGLAKILKRLEFDIDGERFLVHCVTLYEDEKDFTTIRFHEQEVGEVFPADIFDIKNPKLMPDHKQK